MDARIEVLVVGRANARSQPDIELPATEDTVGRRHAEVTVGANGDCYIVDLGSSNGTFVSDNGKWKKIQQSALSSGTPIRLGSYETTISGLLRFRRQATPPPLPTAFVARTQQQSARKPRRNPATGEVE
jgi:pSer/pThr/pTyr-binding forkhead associated (FHA) protein